MAFTYYPSHLGQTDTAGDLTLPAVLAEVRLLLGDTSSENAFLSDEEINHLARKWYPLEKTAEYVASVAADMIAATYASETSYSADGVSINLGGVGEQFRALAASLRAQHRALASYGARVDAGGMNMHDQRDATTAPLSFGTQMHDNYEAGRSDWGDRGGYPYKLPEDYNGE